MDRHQSDDDFQAALLKGPDDDNLRLVYADWLEAQGDARAEYLRLECQLVRNDITITRMQELAAGFESGWLATVTRRAIDLCGPGIGFEFECPKRWEQLSRTPDKNIRFCDHCEQRVYFCTTTEEAREHAFLTRCVCLSPSAIAADGDELASQYLAGQEARTQLLGTFISEANE